MFITHAHFDHMGNIEQFPNATFYIQERELSKWVWAMSLERRFRWLMLGMDPADIMRPSISPARAGSCAWTAIGKTCCRASTCTQRSTRTRGDRCTCTVRNDLPPQSSDAWVFAGDLVVRPRKPARHGPDRPAVHPGRPGDRQPVQPDHDRRGDGQARRRRLHRVIPVHEERLKDLFPSRITKAGLRITELALADGETQAACDDGARLDRSLQGKMRAHHGSTQGLGLAAAQQFAEAGCHVVLNGFASGGRWRRSARHRAAHRRPHAVRRRRSPDPGQIEAMISAAVDAFGAVDILVNNAVVRHAAPVETFAPEQWDEALAVNLSAAFHTIRLALPAMKQRGWGRIINVSSIYGLRGARQPRRVRDDEDRADRLDARGGARNARAGHHLQRDVPGNGRKRRIHEAAIHE